MLIISGVLGVSALTQWGQIDDHNGYVKGRATLSGIGDVDVQFSGTKDPTKHFSEQLEAQALKDEDPDAPGLPVLFLAALIAAASGAYLRSPYRTRAAIGVIAFAAIGFVTGVWRMSNIRMMFNNPVSWSAGEYSPGAGLIAATLAALVLTGLGVTALVLERRVMENVR